MGGIIKRFRSKPETPVVQPEPVVAGPEPAAAEAEPAVPAEGGRAGVRRLRDELRSRGRGWTPPRPRALHGRPFSTRRSDMRRVAVPAGDAGAAVDDVCPKKCAFRFATIMDGHTCPE